MIPDNSTTPNTRAEGDRAASCCSACDGCKWSKMTDEGWCYMFFDAPEKLPCSQHDKFKLEREIMSQMVINNPSIIPMMVMGLDFNDDPPL